MGMGMGSAPRRFSPDFIPTLWNDFAARMKWSVTPNFKDANHKPTVKVEGPLDLTARPGDTVKLSASTWDPDNNAVSVKWLQYKSAGTYPGDISITNPNALTASLQVPADAEVGATIQVLIEATDNGTPPLTHYQQIVITVAK